MKDSMNGGIPSPTTEKNQQLASDVIRTYDQAHVSHKKAVPTFNVFSASRLLNLINKCSLLLIDFTQPLNGLCQCLNESSHQIWLLQ